MEENDEVANKAKNVGKKILKWILFSKILIIGIILVIVIIVISGATYVLEIIACKDTSDAVRSGCKMKVKNANGEEEEIEIEGIEDLVEIKGDSSSGYYIQINYLDEYIKHVLDKSKISYSDLGIKKIDTTFKNMLMAELTTQYPNVSFGYATNDSSDIKNSLKGTIHIKRVTSDDMGAPSDTSDNNVNDVEGRFKWIYRCWRFIYG